MQQLLKVRHLPAHTRPAPAHTRIPACPSHLPAFLSAYTTTQHHTHSVREGYFYASLRLGSPPQRFGLIVDTGSTITYVPCHDCQHCGPNHYNTPYNPRSVVPNLGLTSINQQLYRSAL